MERADELWESAEIGVPLSGDTVILRNHGDPGEGIGHSYEIYTQTEPVYITRAFPSVIRILERKDPA